MIEQFINYINDKNKAYVIFDIGSRDCQQSIEFYKTFPNAKIYAFECNPNTLDLCEQNIIPYQKGKKKYYVVGMNSTLRSKTYISIEAYLKTGDTKYIVRTLGAFLDTSNLNDCLSKKQDIIKDIRPLFPDVMFYESSHAHAFDKSKKSKQYSSAFLLRGNIKSDHIRVECVIWSKKMKKKHNFNNNLVILAMKREVSDWISGGYE